MTRRSQAIVAIIVAVMLLVVGAIIVWPALSALVNIPGALLPAIIMIIGCFAIGGVLMFLLFWSARQGRDEEVYRAAVEERPEDPGEDATKR